MLYNIISEFNIKMLENHFIRFLKLNEFLLHHIILIFIFSIIYFIIAKRYGSKEDKENFTHYSDSLYYTTITHFTVGFGDIAPKSKILKYLTMLQVVLAYSFMNI